MCLRPQQICSHIKTVLLRGGRCWLSHWAGECAISNTFNWWESTAHAFVVVIRHNANRRFLSLKHSHSLCLLPSFSSFWKDDTVAQTPLNNNENGLSGSNASLAKPVSFQTVNMVSEWRGEGEGERGYGENSRFIPEVLMQPSLQWSGRARKTLDLSGPSVP